MLAGLVSGRAGSWSYVFYMLISCDVMALILLLRCVQFYYCDMWCIASELCYRVPLFTAHEAD